MPVITKFYGVVIKMYFKQSEHNPPHIHVIYGDYIGVIEIRTGHMIEGDLPIRAHRMVQDWMSHHRSKLLEMWKTQKFEELPPLE